MNIRNLNIPGGWRSSATFCLIAVLVGFFCLQQPCQGQLAASSNPLTQINWLSGPQTITLADCADIQIPQGYHLTDKQGGRIALQSINTPVPDNLIGVLTMDSGAGKWWAIVQYTPAGLLKDAQTEKLDTAALLKSLQAKIKPASLSWQSAPAYDANTYALSWSVDATSGSAKVLNETVILFGRRGYFEITAVRPYPLGSAPSLKEFVSNITFKDGERYTDYQSGDRLAQISLADLIVGASNQATAGVSHHNFAAATVWIYSGLGVCVVLGSVMLLRKKDRRRVVREPAHAHVSHHKVAAAPVAAVAPAAPVTATAAAQPTQPSAALNGQQNGVAEQKKVTKHFHRSRRKKVFNYPKFYTNVMRELSLHAYGPGVTNGKSHTNGHTNGHANGHTNGHANGANGNGNGYTNGHANGATNGTNGSGVVGDSIKSEIIELIATQKNLIQEQKCLLEQQTKLIEEKRWLIEEQTAFLKNQAGQQYPLKFE